MIATSFARARPLWPAVWLLLLLASLMGIMKPGEQGSASGEEYLPVHHQSMGIGQINFVVAINATSAIVA